MSKNLFAAAAFSLGLATSQSALAQNSPSVKKISDVTAAQTSELLQNTQALTQTIEVTPDIIGRFSAVQSNLLGTILTGGVVVGFYDGRAATSIDVRVGKNEQEILATLGFKVTENAMIRFSFQDIRQYIDFLFRSGKVQEQVSQNTIGATLRIKNITQFIEWLEFSGYHIDAPSKMLAPKEYYIDTPTLYQLWEDQRRIAGAKKTGILSTARISVSQAFKLELSLGYENEKIDYINNPETNNRITSKIKTIYDINDNISMYASIGSNLASTGEIGLTYISDKGLKISPALTYVKGQNGMKDAIMTGVRLEIPLESTKIKRRNNISNVNNAGETPEKPYSVSWSELPKNTQDDIISGKYIPTSSIHDSIKAERNDSLTPRDVMNFVGARPVWMPYMVNARVDTSLKPKFLVEIDPAGLPAGSKINLPNGDISLTFPFAVGTLVSAVNNTNGKILGSETFTLSGNNITIHTRQLEKYLTGPNLLTLTTTNAIVVIDAYNGSVYIKSITLQSNIVDAPPSVVAPTVTKTDTTATLTNGITDADGVRNITYYIYSDAGGTSLVAQNTTGSFTGLTGSTTYYARTSAEVRNNVTNAWALQTSGLRAFTTDAPAPVDNPPSVVAPTVTKTDTTATLTNGITDADGVRNITYYIYSDAGGTSLVAQNTTGSFTGLTGSTTYYARTSAEVRNNVTNAWALQTSGLRAFTTDAPAPVDNPPSVVAPTVTKTDTTATLTNGITDADGVRNITYYIYSDAGGTSLVAQNTTGSFTGLTGSTTYYARTSAEVRNNVTNAWALQTSGLRAFTTDAPAPVDNPPSVVAPTVTKTDTTATLTNGITDADGVRNITYYIYSDAGGTSLVAQNTTGSFTGLTGSTTYYARTSAEVRNNVTNAWALQTSGLRAFTTDAPAPVDNPPSVVAPTVTKTDTTATLTNGITDADGVRNITYYIYSDAGGTSLVAQNTTGSFTGLTGSTTYYARTSAEVRNNVTNAWALQTSGLRAFTTDAPAPVDNPPSVVAPTVTKTDTTATLTNGITDADGVRNITYYIYSDAGGTSLVAQNTTGSFTGLTGSTTYYARTSAEVRNNVTNAWALQTSGLRAFTTDAPAPVDNPPSVVAPTVTKTDTTATLTNGITDADGVRNITYYIYSDAGGTSLVAQNTTGSFTGLTGSTTYYARTSAEVRNNVTNAWALQTSGLRAFTTDAPAPVDNPPSVVAPTVTKTDTTATLTNGITDADGVRNITYYIYSDAGGTSLVAQNTTGSFTGLTGSTTYYARTSAEVRNNVTNAWALQTSGLRAFTTDAPAPVDNPPSVVAPTVTKTDTTATLTNGITDADGVRNITYYIYSDAGGTSLVAQNTTGSFTGLTGSTTYYARTSAEVRNNVTNAWALQTSGLRAFTTDAPAPVDNPPSVVAPTVTKTDTTATLTNGITDADGVRNITYYIYSDAGGTSLVAQNTTGSFTGLTGSTTYYARTSAEVRNNVTNAWALQTSGLRAFTTDAPAPVDNPPSVVAPTVTKTDTTATLTNGITDADGVRNITYYIYSDAGGTSLVAQNTTGSFTGLTGSTTYYARTSAEVRNNVTNAWALQTSGLRAFTTDAPAPVDNPPSVVAPTVTKTDTTATLTNGITDADGVRNITYYIYSDAGGTSLVAQNTTGSFTGLTGSTTYYARTSAEVRNNVTNAWALQTSGLRAFTTDAPAPVDNPPSVVAPTVTKTDTTATLTNGITDADGVRNITYYIYSDAGGTSLVAQNTTGSFTGLTGSTTYYARTSAEVRNNVTNAWALQTSGLRAFTTDAPAPVDNPPSVVAPTVTKTDTTATLTNGITDADGVRNITYYIYSDAGGTSLVAQNTTGSFTGLTGSTTYYARTSAEVRNNVTNAWALQTSGLRAFTTDAPAPVDNPPSVVAPTVTKTDTTATLTNGITDADGVRNITYYIYSDAGGTSLVAQNTTGSFTGLTGSTTYYARTSAEVRNNVTNAWALQTSGLRAFTTDAPAPVDNPPSVVAPTVTKTDTTATLTNGITDADGVRNITYYIYSDAGGTSLVAQNTTGSFTGLTGSTTYYARTSAEVRNNVTNAWALQTSGLRAFTTDAPAPVDNPPSVVAPTVTKTDTTATLTNGITDADGVRNITYYIYSDAGGTSLVAQNTTGSFTGLTGSTTYYARTSAEVRNNVTNAWALQTSGLRAFTTDAPAPVDNPPSVVAPTVTKTDTTATLTNGITDADGVRNITYYIYSDAGGTSLVAQNTTGSFTGLTGSTTYYARTSAEVRNNVTNAWALQTSGLRAFTTDAPLVIPFTWTIGVTSSYPGNRGTNIPYTSPGVACTAEEANLSSCGITVNSMSGSYTTSDIQSVNISGIGPMSWSQVSAGYYNLFVPGAVSEQSGTGTITITLTNGQSYSNVFSWFVDQLGVGIGN